MVNGCKACAAGNPGNWSPLEGINNYIENYEQNSKSILYKSCECIP